MKRIILFCAFFIGIAATGFSQSENMKEKATEKVEELNAEIASIDKSLALTEDQKRKMEIVHLERMKEVRKARKEGKDQEEIKAINKRYFQIIYSDILTKDQKKARSLAKKADSEDED